MRLFDEPFNSQMAWTGASLGEQDWLRRLPSDVLDELSAAAARLRRDPLPTFLVDAEAFELSATRRFMAGIDRDLRDGSRFVLLDRLPIDAFGKDIAIQIYWLLCSMLAPPVAQKIDGTMLYNVWDTGKPLIPGTGVRGADTNYEQAFHNDNTFNEAAPDYVALFCLNPAKEGGRSRNISIYAVHNKLLAGHRDVLPRLYEPFLIDRESEHLPDEPITLQAPVFTRDGGRLVTRMTLRQIENGYVRAGRDMDAAGRAAVKTVREVMKQPDLMCEFTMERGQIQIVNNLETAHCRTGFIDWAEPERRRHLVRLWLRRAGRRTYSGR